MEFLSGNCSTCYETYTDAEDALLPRILPCTHHACTRCLKEVFDNGSLCCPECFTTVETPSIEHLPVAPPDNAAQNEPNSEDSEEALAETSHNRSRSQEAPFTPGAPAAPFRSLSADSSKLASFLSSNPPIRPSTRAGVRRGSMEIPDEKRCLIYGCPNARANHGFCVFHATNRRYSVSVPEMVEELKKTHMDEFNFDPNSGTVKPNAGAWPEIDPAALVERFKNQKRMEIGEVLDLIERARQVLRQEANILKIEAPVTVVGDIHGQFFDLLNLLDVGGRIGTDTSYLFLGDYVDRGKFSCEVILYLLALKVTYPSKVWLIRGNHECRSVTGHFGFKEECKNKYGLTVYYRVLLAFETMPIAATILTSYGKIFACHGGISPSLESLDDIENIDRFVEPDMKGALCDLLWADPISEEGIREMSDEQYQQFLSINWKPNPIRGCSYCFGYAAIKKFLSDNNLLCMIRAHEVQEQGYARHFDPINDESRGHDSPQRQKHHRNLSSISFSSDFFSECGGSDSGDDDLSDMPEFPPVITIFSAPNYCDRYNNKAAILRIDQQLDGFRVLQYDCVPHPEPEDNESEDNQHMLSMIKTCPYMPTTLRDFVRLAVELGPSSENIFDEDENDVDEDYEETTGEISSDILPVDDVPASEEIRVVACSEDLELDSTSVVVNQAHGVEKRNARPSLSLDLLTPGEHRELFIPRKRRESAPEDDQDPHLALKRNSSVHTTEVLKRKSSLSGVTKTETTEGDAILPPLGLSVAANTGPFTKRSNDGHKPHTPSPEKPMVGIDEGEGPKEGPRKRNTMPARSRHRSSVYRLAAARDGINEMHPEILERRIQQLDNDNMALFPEDSEHDQRRYSFSHEVPEEEKPAFSVAEIRRRFEKKNSASNLSLLSSKRSQSLASVSDVKAAPASVAELRRLFENSVSDRRGSMKSVSQLISMHKKALEQSQAEAETSQALSPIPEDVEPHHRKNKSSLVALMFKTVEEPPDAQADKVFRAVESASQTSTSDEQKSTSLQHTSPNPRVSPNPSPNSNSSDEVSSTSEVSSGRTSTETVAESKINHDNSEPDTNPQPLGKRGKKIKGRTTAQITFTREEILAIKLTFSLLDQSGDNFIELDEFYNYAEDTGDFSAMRDMKQAMSYVDVDKDGKIGLLDFIHFAARLKELHEVNKYASLLSELKEKSGSDQDEEEGFSPNEA